MQFNTFLNLIPKIKQIPLMASEAHLKMAPLERIKYYDKDYDFSVHNPRESAVLSLFYPKQDETHLLLIVRATYPGIHSSQIAFPGGKREVEDFDLMATALRETNEEVGIQPNEIEVVRKFSDLYIPPSNFLVSPYMGVHHQEIEIHIDPREVASYIEVPLKELLNDALISDIKMSTSYANEIMVPAFVIEDHVVWGATAMILSEIKDTINNVLIK
ncbi:CoA pyrophosphatase [Myroides ceti]|uniref:CoA pyrophosphatase n=1 Tax=Paenimyroides ceti TaxID=395087 RepID=A0ABT8CTK7_9FLAO|nr:CoA pyrophosphatase [Paenimyroides ceti]MDN3707565.1 CoA pyrophosphatase [Paenimyroides ceti]